MGHKIALAGQVLLQKQGGGLTQSDEPKDRSDNELEAVAGGDQAPATPLRMPRMASKKRHREYCSEPEQNTILILVRNVAFLIQVARISQ